MRECELFKLDIKFTLLLTSQQHGFISISRILMLLIPITIILVQIMVDLSLIKSLLQ